MSMSFLKLLEQFILQDISSLWKHIFKFQDFSMIFITSESLKKCLHGRTWYDKYPYKNQELKPEA